MAAVGLTQLVGNETPLINSEVKQLVQKAQLLKCLETRSEIFIQFCSLKAYLNPMRLQVTHQVLNFRAALSTRVLY